MTSRSIVTRTRARFPRGGPEPRFVSRRGSAARSLIFGVCTGAFVSAGVTAWAPPAAADEPTIDAIEYRPSELPPPGARGRLILTGLGVSAAWYGVSLGSSYLWQDAPNAKDLRLPVVGPWLGLRDPSCGSAESGCSTPIAVFRTAIAIISGVGQIGGLFAVAEGVLLDTASDANAASVSTPRATTPSVSAVATPVLLPDGALVEISGRF